MLSTPALITCEEVLGDGWTGLVSQGSQYIIAHGPVAGTYEEIRDGAFTAAQRALDIMSIRGRSDLRTERADDEHVCWWIEEASKVVRIVAIDSKSFRIDLALSITRADGTVDPPLAPQHILYRESFRYFRLSQATDDVFDAFRNLYLALESILSDIAPQQLNLKTGRPSEREGVWVKRALQKAATRTELMPFASPGSKDPLAEVFGDIYAGTRTGVFHAKHGRRRLDSGSPEDRRELLEGLKRLVGLYLTLVRDWQGFSRLGSGMTEIGAEHFVGLRDITPVVFAASFKASSVSGDPGQAERSLTALELDTRAAPKWNPTFNGELDQPFARHFLGTANGLEAAQLEHIALVGLANKNNPEDPLVVVRIELAGSVEVTGIDRLEVLTGKRMRNGSQPKTVYRM